MTRTNLLLAAKKDADFLISHDILDYSLLVGIERLQDEEQWNGQDEFSRLMGKSHVFVNLE